MPFWETNFFCKCLPHALWIFCHKWFHKFLPPPPTTSHSYTIAGYSFIPLCHSEGYRARNGGPTKQSQCRPTFLVCSIQLLSSHLQGALEFPRGFLVGWVVENPPANAGGARDIGLIPASGRAPGEGNTKPLQDSCLGNSMERSLEGYSPWGGKEPNRNEQLITHSWAAAFRIKAQGLPWQSSG